MSDKIFNQLKLIIGQDAPKVKMLSTILNAIFAFLVEDQQDNGSSKKN